MNRLYEVVTKYPKVFIALVAVITLFMLSQLNDLRWETDARVYMPKGHDAIKYDEKIENLFGAKDAIVLIVKNEKESIYNKETIERIRRLTEKISSLPGVIANRALDVMSPTTATIFEGDEESMRAVRLISPDEAALNIDKIKAATAEHEDILIGNVISQDGSSAMIRAKLKEGAANRYQTYWQIKGIINAEFSNTGGSTESQSTAWGNGDWDGQAQWAEGDADWQRWEGGGELSTLSNGDEIYLAGRPVIEVTSGVHAMEDMKIMIPLLVAVMACALFLIFKTGGGVVIPLLVMMGSILWTLGAMVLLDIPLYTISTMLPVILVAVGIGDSVHLLSHYYNKVLDNPYRKSRELVKEVLTNLGPPLITTSLTTAVGFLSLLLAEMPPFKVFGLFTVLGIFFSWVLTICLAVPLLVVMKPKVNGYYAKRRSLRVRSEQDRLTTMLIAMGRGLNLNRNKATVLVSITVLIVGFGMTKLYVNSSWLSDFDENSEIVQSTDLINERFDGAVFLNIVVEGDEKDVLKDPVLLNRIDALQQFAEGLEYVGDSISVVDYLKSLNKTLHAMDDAYYVVPKTKGEIAEALYLYSVSGQPELLDEVVDYDYQNANITVFIKTDETLHLKYIRDRIDEYVRVNFADQNVEINYAGSANNSYVWAELLINSQVSALLFSKIAIFLLAALWFRSIYIGLAIVLPVVVTTTLVAGGAGWMGIPMDVSSVLAAGIAIGVGVDYAVHYVFRYTSSRNNGLDHQEAVSDTLRSVGRAIVLNAAVVVCGFSVLLLSQFPPHEKLGGFVVIYMIISCISALVILPLSLKLLNSKRFKQTASDA